MHTPLSRVATSAVVFVFLLVLGCRQNSKTKPEVRWPELNALDVPSAKAEGLAKKAQVDALRTMMPELSDLAAAVSEESLPGNAKSPEPTRVLLRDLADLVVQARTADSLDDDTLLAVGAAFHPLVAKLMEESGMPHLHKGEGPNGGWLQPLKADGKEVGQLEIKLHDDAGDLEIWLTRGQSGDQPLDLPLETVIRIDFPKMENRSVALRVRNTEENEGEDGVSTIRKGLTNYFIFPSENGADASWLMGKEFATPITISFSADEAAYEAGPFDLKPHVH